MFAPACIYYWLHVFSVYMLFSNANLCWWFCCLLPSLDAGATPSVGFCSCARVFAKKPNFFFQRVRVTSQSCDSERERVMAGVQQHAVNTKPLPFLNL